MEYKTLQARISKLAKSTDCTDKESRFLSRLCRVIRPQFEASFTACELPKLDRTRSMLHGIPWTSASYPWPLGENGAPLGPILQLNLDQISLMSNRQCGSGLLQVFMPSHAEPYCKSDHDSSCVSRIVPWDAIKRTSEPTSFPWQDKRPLDILTELSIDWDLSKEDIEIPRSYDELSELRHDDPRKAARIEAVLTDRMAEAGFVSNAYDLAPAQLIAGWQFENFWLFLSLAALSDVDILNELRRSDVLRECAGYIGALEDFEDWMYEKYCLEDESRLLSLGISASMNTSVRARLFPHHFATRQFEGDEPQGDALPLIECSGPDRACDSVGVSTSFDAVLLRSAYPSFV